MFWPYSFLVFIQTFKELIRCLSIFSLRSTTQKTSYSSEMRIYVTLLMETPELHLTG